MVVVITSPAASEHTCEADCLCLQHATCILSCHSVLYVSSVTKPMETAKVAKRCETGGCHNSVTKYPSILGYCTISMGGQAPEFLRTIVFWGGGTVQSLAGL